MFDHEGGVAPAFETSVADQVEGDKSLDAGETTFENPAADQGEGGNEFAAGETFCMSPMSP